jgi:hypothetical protein
LAGIFLYTSSGAHLIPKVALWTLSYRCSDSNSGQSPGQIVEGGQPCCMFSMSVRLTPKPTN